MVTWFFTYRFCPKQNWKALQKTKKKKGRKISKAFFSAQIKSFHSKWLSVCFSHHPTFMVCSPCQSVTQWNSLHQTPGRVSSFPVFLIPGRYSDEEKIEPRRNQDQFRWVLQSWSPVTECGECPCRPWEMIYEWCQQKNQGWFPINHIPKYFNKGWHSGPWKLIS